MSPFETEVEKRLYLIEKNSRELQELLFRKMKVQQVIKTLPDNSQHVLMIQKIIEDYEGLVIYVR